MPVSYFSAAIENPISRQVGRIQKPYMCKEDGQACNVEKGLTNEEHNENVNGSEKEQTVLV